MKLKTSMITEECSKILLSLVLKYIFEIKSNEVSGNLLNFLANFLIHKKTLIVLNGRCSSWSRISACLPQIWITSFLDSLNDFTNNMYLNSIFFANNISLFSAYRYTISSTK